MPLYSLVRLRDQQEKNRKQKTRISDLDHTESDRITLNHDGVHIDTSLNETIFWDNIKMKIVGAMDCSNNPPFPKAHGGDTYIISVPGMFGSYEVEQGDLLLALSDVEETRDERFEKLWFHFSKSGGGGSMATIPVATNTTLGGILAGEDILVNSDGHVTVVDDSHKHTTATITGLDEILGEKAGIDHTHPVSDITDFNEVLNSELDAFSDSFKQPMKGASNLAPGTSGMTPRPLAGDQNKFLKGDGTWDYPDIDTSLADLGVTATSAELSYSTGLTGNIQHQIDDLADLLDTKANAVHTHNYAGSATAGGSAASAEKLMHILSISQNGQNKKSFDGSVNVDIDITPASIGAANLNHGNHVPNYGSENNNQTLMVIDGQLAWGSGGTSEEDPIQYSVFTGTDGSGDGSIGLVPAPKATDSGKFLGSSGKWESPVTKLGDLGVTASTAELNYVKGVTSSIQDQLNDKSPSNHTHNYAASSTPGGNAITADKVVHSLGIKLGDSGSLQSFNGSEDLNLSVNPSTIGAAALNHGIHVKSYEGVSSGKIYGITENGPDWIDPPASGLVGSANSDHILVFNDSKGTYKDSGKTISNSVSQTPSSNIILTEAGIAAYVQSLVSQFTKKSTMVLGNYSIKSSEGDMIAFQEPVVLKKISLKAISDITASGFKITRGEDTIFSVSDSNMITGKVYEYSLYAHLDASIDPLHISFQDYAGGEASIYLEYAYDSMRDLDTGESNIYLISKNLYNDQLNLHSFYTNGFIRSITINPIEEYNSETTVSIKVGEYSLYNQKVSLTKDTPVTLDFYYPVTATEDSQKDLTVTIDGYTEGSSKVYLEYADELTVNTVNSIVATAASQTEKDSARLNEILDTMTSSQT